MDLLQRYAQFTIFDKVSHEKMKRILADLQIESIPEGEILIERENYNDTVFLLLEGQAKVYLHKDKEPINIMEAGDSIGEISVLDGKPGSVNIITSQPCKLIKINKQKIWQLIDSSHAFTRNLLNILLERVRTVNDHFDDSMQVQQEMTVKATRDALTGLYNRRWFDDNFDHLLNRCIESETPFSFIMLDIDHFKQVNDVYGHAAGDLVLQQVAELLQGHARSRDAAVRYGGEEMSLILPQTHLDESANVAERIRIAIEAVDFTISDKQTIKVTVSLGCAAYNGHNTKQEIMKTADEGLYHAKEHGRNQVVVYENIIKKSDKLCRTG